MAFKSQNLTEALNSANATIFSASKGLTSIIAFRVGAEQAKTQENTSTSFHSRSQLQVLGNQRLISVASIHNQAKADKTY
jgi:hypothetical protein